MTIARSFLRCGGTEPSGATYRLFGAFPESAVHYLKGLCNYLPKSRESQSHRCAHASRITRERVGTGTGYNDHTAKHTHTHTHGQAYESVGLTLRGASATYHNLVVAHGAINLQLSSSSHFVFPPLSSLSQPFRQKVNLMRSACVYRLRLFFLFIVLCGRIRAIASRAIRV